jgi:hypothetical protein
MPNDAEIIAQLDQIRDAAEEAPGDGIHIEWPPDFFICDGAIWYQPKPTSREAEPTPIWVCATIRPLAETVDEQGGAWGLLLRWEDRDGRTHEWAVPRRLVHAVGNDIAAELEHAGLTVGTSQQAHERLKQFLGRIKVRQRKRCVARTGWHQTDAGHVYVMMDGVMVGPGAASVVLQTGRSSIPRRGEARGTLAEWQEHVARYAVRNSRIALMTSAAFAGPLLDITGDQSGGVHLVGNSQTGKTTALRCGASAWGKADSDGVLESWRTTSNGMEGVAAQRCDGFIPLDEMGQANARDVGETVYGLANERGKVRAARDGSLRTPLTWRVLRIYGRGDACGQDGGGGPNADGRARGAASQHPGGRRQGRWDLSRVAWVQWRRRAIRLSDPRNPDLLRHRGAGLP